MDQEHLWSAPPVDFMLMSDQVHIWSASLDQSPSRVQQLQTFLTEDEQARAKRFYRQKDRDRFVVARGLLREILSSYLDSDPALLHFCYGPAGKPALHAPFDKLNLCFNLSHSNDLALYAVTRGRAVGIDIEYIRTSPTLERVAARLFSPQEYAAFQKLPVLLRNKAFFRYWVRKEAYIKARGLGLSLLIRQFEAYPTTNQSPTQSKPGSIESLDWSLHDIEPMPGYAAALTVEGQNVELSCWSWAKDESECEGCWQPQLFPQE